MNLTFKKLFMDFVLASLATILLSLCFILPASPAASQVDGGETPPPPLIFFPSIFKNHATEELAFVRVKNPLDADIYLTNSDGTFLKNLTNTPDCQEIRFAWSPDGSKLAYTSHCENNDYGIYVMNSDGSGKNRLTGNMVDGYSLAWSMDGTQIAFDSSLEGNKDIYVVKADGSELTKLTDNPRTDTQPSWSPVDLNKIVFMCDINPNFDICVINSDGTGLTDLTKNIGYSALSDGASAWSPDGSKILFTATIGYGLEICVMNSDGSGINNITNNTGNFWYSSWSPDGKKIVFDYDGAIGVINVDGSGFKTFTPFTTNFIPVWSRDGTMIAFTGYLGGEEKVYVMNSDGTELRVIANLPGDESLPIWRP
jgi:Tol biopolymer transport system component